MFAREHTWPFLSQPKGQAQSCCFRPSALLIASVLCCVTHPCLFCEDFSGQDSVPAARASKVGTLFSGCPTHKRVVKVTEQDNLWRDQGYVQIV